MVRRQEGGGTSGAVTGGRRYEWCGDRREEVRVVQWQEGGGTSGAVTGGRRYEWCGDRREEVRVMRVTEGRRQALTSVATALASMVLPVPGGPKSSTPFTASAATPSLYNRGYFRGYVTHCLSVSFT